MNWRPVPGYEGLYDVSDTGAIRSWPRRGTRTTEKTLRVPYADAKGYLRIGLRRNSASRGRAVHRLVLEAFVGPPPSPWHQVNHKNGVKDDNRLENLEWVTQSENNHHAIDTGLRTPPRGERVNTAKLTAEDAAAIKADSTSSDEILAARYGCSRSNIWAIRTGRNWSWVDPAEELLA